MTKKQPSPRPSSKKRAKRATSPPNSTASGGPALSAKTRRQPKAGPKLESIGTAAISEKWFAPMVGLRSRSRWVGLIGLEIEPAKPHVAQRPIWRLLIWEPVPGNKTTGVSQIFDHYWDAIPDHRRYPGKWIPIADSSGPPEFGKAYLDSQVPTISGFDQVVLLNWSETKPIQHQPEWRECSVVISKGGLARVEDDHHVLVSGATLLPLGIPDEQGNGTQTVPLRLKI